MRKRVIPSTQEEAAAEGEVWLDLDALAQVEITSEDAEHPIESALLPSVGTGWRAGTAGEQTIRLVFDHSQRVQRIALDFVEPEVERTQEYVVRWSPDGGETFHEVVRQRWNFSPQGATRETEDHEVDLAPVTVLEVIIVPDVSGGEARASLAQLRLA